MGFGSCNVAVYGYGYSCPDLLEPKPGPDLGLVMKGDKVSVLICPVRAVVWVLVLAFLPEYPKP